MCKPAESGICRKKLVMRFVILLIFTLTGLCLNAQDTVRTQAGLNKATVYFGYGAELTHDARPGVTSQTKYIIIDQLSTRLDINSLQVNCPEDISILSQQFQLYTPPAPTPVKTREQELLEDSIRKLGKEISKLENRVQIEQETMNKTGLLIEATLTGQGKTVTSADVLKLVEFYNNKIETAREKTFALRDQVSGLQERISALRKKIDGMRDPDLVVPKSSGRLILQIVSKRSGQIPLTLSYYTAQAGWTPLYDVRVNSKTNKVKLVYKAALTQTTGIDWVKARLTLSTGTPRFGVVAPVLSPWNLQLYVPELYRSMQDRAAYMNNSRNQLQTFSRDKELSEVIVTGLGNDLQYKSFDTSKIPSTVQDFTTLTEGMLNTNYEIDLPYTITSDGQLHSVNIKDEDVNCILKNYAVPKVDRDAYLLAELADWQNLDLLPGEANIIVDDTYIGKSNIDPNVTADTLHLSLGRDSRIAVKRSLVKELSSLKSTGGSNRQTFTYEILVKNNKITDVNLLLKDQFPLSNIKEVEVKLEDAGGAIINEEAGVLTWKLELKPGESKKLRFSYSVKYPKDKKIANLR